MLWEYQLQKATGDVSLTKEWILLLLPWCSYWFYRFPRLIPLCLLLISFSLLAESINIIKSYWPDLGKLWRDAYIFRAHGHGAYFGVATLGLIIFLPRFYNYIKSRPALWPAMVLYLGCLFWFLQCMIFSEARTAWIPFFLALTIVIVTIFARLIKMPSGRPKKTLSATLLIITLFISSISYFNSDKITSRFTDNKDWEMISRLINGNEDIKLTSATYRHFANLYGIEVWKTSPLIGLGPIDSHTIITQHENTNLHSLAHFHNTYIEILVQLGAIGLIFCLVGIFYLYYSTYKCYKSCTFPGDYFLFFTCSLVVISLWSFANYRLLNADWRFFWILFIGIFHSQVLTYYLNKRIKH